MLVQQLTQSDFIDAFRKLRPDNFTYEGLVALYQHLDDYANEIGEDFLEVDVIGICCDYTETTPEEILDSYNLKVKEGQTAYEVAEAFLAEHTIVIEVGNGNLIYVNY